VTGAGETGGREVRARSGIASFRGADERLRQAGLTVRRALVGVAGLVPGALALAVAAAVLGLGAVAVAIGELHAAAARPRAGAPRAPRAPAAVHRRLQEATRSCWIPPRAHPSPAACSQVWKPPPELVSPHRQPGPRPSKALEHIRSYY